MSNRKLNHAEQAKPSGDKAEVIVPPMWNRDNFFRAGAGGPISSALVLGVGDDSNAAAGHLGEYMEASGGVESQIDLPSGSPVEVASLVLTPGDWDVRGDMVWAWGGQHVTQFMGGFAIGDFGTFDPTNFNGVVINRASLTLNFPDCLAMPTIRVQVPAATTLEVFLVAQATYTVGTAAVAGKLAARRVR